MQPALMKVEDAARFLSLGRSKTYALIAAGVIPVVRIGRCTRVPTAAVLALIDGQLSQQRGELADVTE